MNKIVTNISATDNLYSKIFEIEIPSNVFINTFSCVFDCYAMNSYIEPYCARYILTIVSSSTIRLNKMSVDGKNSISNFVGYKINGNICEVYLKCPKAFAYTYCDIVFQTPTSYLVKTPFNSPLNISGLTYATEGDNYLYGSYISRKYSNMFYNGPTSFTHQLVNYTSNTIYYITINCNAKYNKFYLKGSTVTTVDGNSNIAITNNNGTITISGLDQYAFTLLEYSYSY